MDLYNYILILAIWNPLNAYVNTHHVAGVSRRQAQLSQNLPNLSPFWDLVTILDIYHAECIPISTNIPNTCVVICEIRVEYQRILIKENALLHGEVNDRVEVLTLPLRWISSKYFILTSKLDDWSTFLIEIFYLDFEAWWLKQCFSWSHLF